MTYSCKCECNNLDRHGVEKLIVDDAFVTLVCKPHDDIDPILE
jgi:hypothetical protein